MDNLELLLRGSTFIERFWKYSSVAWTPSITTRRTNAATSFDLFVSTVSPSTLIIALPTNDRLKANLTQ